MTEEGAQNTAIGRAALLNNTTGSYNTATGSGNMGIGSITLSNNSSGNNNIALGFAAAGAFSTANNVIAIGSLGQNVDNSCFIGEIYTNIQPQVGTDPDLVTINSNGRLGRANVSSRRYKHDIHPMQAASEAIYELKPVSFRYHKQYDRNADDCLWTDRGGSGRSESRFGGAQPARTAGISSVRADQRDVTQ